MYLVLFLIDIIQEECHKVVSEYSFMLKYCHDRYKTQNICDKAVDSYLLALKFVPDWFVTSNMIEKLDNAIYFLMIILSLVISTLILLHLLSMI